MVTYIRGTDNFDTDGVNSAATAGGVGTYAFVTDYAAYPHHSFGGTVAGSSIKPVVLYKTGNVETTAYSTMGMVATNESYLSGTWRVMSGASYATGSRSFMFLAVRIS